MRLLISIICACLVASCATLPGQYSEKVSKFDNSKHLKMAPNHISGWMPQFNIGLDWNTTAPELLYFTVQIPGSIVSIDGSYGLQFNIDGEVVRLDSNEAVTNTKARYNSTAGYTFTSSEKPFVGSVELLEKICTASSVKVKLNTRKGYREGVILGGKEAPVIKTMRKFLVKIKANR